MKQERLKYNVYQPPVYFNLEYNPRNHKRGYFRVPNITLLILLKMMYNYKSKTKLYTGSSKAIEFVECYLKQR